MIVLVVALMMPPEVRVNLAGQTLYAYRLAWMLLLPWTIVRLRQGDLTWRLNDLFVFLGSAWMTVSFMIVYGPGPGFMPGMALTLDVFMPYLIARLAIRDLNDLRRALIFMAPLVFLVAAILPLEGLADRRYLRDAAAAIFGNLGAAEFGSSFEPSIAMDQRYGLLRAMGPFSHPILAGLFFSSLLPLYHFSRIRGWPKVLGMLSGLGAVFTFSSAAMIGLILFFVFAVFDAVRRIVTFLNWPIFMGATVAVLSALHVVSQNGLIAVLIRYTFNPASGRYRLLIWEYGSNSVERHPLFGIGFAQFDGLDWMGNSVDAFWLAIAVRNGLPAAVFLVLATLLAFVGLTLAVRRETGPDEATLIGLAATICVIFLLGFTVSFFGGLLTWFAILLGVATTFGGLTMPRRSATTLPLGPAVQPAAFGQGTR
ncbi:O-antigen ligase [Erythrobacter sp. HL-111]|uniref:O-antigen ligase family protein n=1 Tax=Erythrobacter sp. HL-111 TaxID=1798193 RepID=UPI00087953E7|nr:O-antigen ligase family protein [Erythrobacter sp. HL-111]SDS54642.1 O-antigen ligase [Erythrobacter sp. HL-111]